MVNWYYILSMSLWSKSNNNNALCNEMLLLIH